MNVTQRTADLSAEHHPDVTWVHTAKTRLVHTNQNTPSEQKYYIFFMSVQDVEISSDLFDYSTPHEQATDGLGGGEQLEAGETRLGTPVHTVDTTSMRAPDHLALVALVYHLPLFVLGLAGWVTRHWHNSNGRCAYPSLP